MGNLEKRKRNAKILIALSICIILSGTLFLVFDTRYMGVGWVPDRGGLWYVSETYSSNSNVSYTVIFHEVHFTFLYWTYPWPLQDADYTAYFLIEFADNSSTTLSISTGSYWFTAYPSMRPLSSITTIDTFPIAGLLYAGNLEPNWRFIVSLF